MDSSVHLAGVAEQVRIVRLPVNRISAFQKITRTFAELEQKYQREPSVDEIALAAGATCELVDNLMMNSGKGISIDSPLRSGEDGTMLDVVFDDSNPMPDHSLLKESLQCEISRLVDSLNPREAKVISLHFGLAGTRAMNLEEIGENLGLTRERVRQIKEAGIRSLRRLSACTGLNSYL